MPLPSNFKQIYSHILASDPHEFIRGRLEDTLCHPGFKQASIECRKLFSACMADDLGKSDHSQLSALTLDLLIIYFHVEQKLNSDARIGTMSAMKSYAEKSAIASGRQVYTLVSRLVDLGRVVRKAHPRDHRIQWLIPTPAMMEGTKAFALCFLEPLAHLDYPVENIALFSARPDLQETCLHRVSYEWLKGCNPITPFKPIRYLMTKARALPMINELILRTASHYGTVYAMKPVPFSVGALSEAHRISRSHVRLVLDDLERGGFVELDYPRQEILIKAEISLATDCLIAASFIMFEAGLTKALAAPAGLKPGGLSAAG